MPSKSAIADRLVYRGILVRITGKSKRSDQKVDSGCPAVDGGRVPSRSDSRRRYPFFRREERDPASGS
jgi:hypothetical protein